MFVQITNTPRDYGWGSTSAISDLLGTTPSGGPEAELWLGDHPGSPARLVGGPSDAEDLRDVVDTPLPFLLKVLAADSPLSLQAHPTLEQARAGFAAEDAAGIRRDAPHRNYKDPNHKPELIVAVSDTFDALCGFRSAAETRADLDRLPAHPVIADFAARLADDADLRSVFEWLITRGDGVAELVDALTAAVADSAVVSSSLSFETVRMLAAEYPGDPGVAISMLLHTVRLQRGEALYLPAGNIHAYLRGLGIELMAASDNVLRGGLTPKHVDVPELLRVLDFRPLPVPYLEPETPAEGVRVFRPDVRDFLLVEVTGRSAQHVLTGSAIALCTAGAVEVAGRSGSVRLERGGAVYVAADEHEVRVSGGGTLFLATTG